MAESSKTTLAEAFLAAQKAMKNPAKSQTACIRGKDKNGNDYEYEYNYASLDDTMECVKEALNAHGIALTQPMIAEDGDTGVAVEIHGHGEKWELGRLVMPCPGDPQSLGKILTYLRRYSLGAVGVVAEEDDDAAGVKTGKPSGGKPAPENQIKAVWGKARALGMSDKAVFKMCQRDAGVDHPDKLTYPAAKQVLDRMQAAIEDKEAKDAKEAVEEPTEGGMSDEAIPF